MMNVNLNLDRHDLELLSVALRLHVDTMTDLSQSQYLPEQSRNQYASDLNRVPHILDVLTMLQVQTIMHDCVQPVSA